MTKLIDTNIHKHWDRIKNCPYWTVESDYTDGYAVGRSVHYPTHQAALEAFRKQHPKAWAQE